MDNAWVELHVAVSVRIWQPIRWFCNALHEAVSIPYTGCSLSNCAPDAAVVMLQADPALTAYSRDMIINAAKQLHAAKMAVFDERSGNLFVTELGRVASHFYIRSV